MPTCSCVADPDSDVRRGVDGASGLDAGRGPFAESKELIAGFSVLSEPMRADAIAWAERYAAILGDNEADVRELAD